jgi:glutamate dehydrogenase
MSGDVFGNGMLLSRAHPAGRGLRPPAHLHRPRPGRGDAPSPSARLFAPAALVVGDYDRALISRGGGVFRARQVDRRHARRCARRWASGPTVHLADADRADPRDPAGAGRPAVERRHRHLRQGRARPRRGRRPRQRRGPRRRRASCAPGHRRGRQPRADAAGRIEAALNGGRINTDAIDNSAGVDTSDHEVNIKILLGPGRARGDLTDKQRNELLASMTDEVASQVLRDNYEQNVLLGNARARARDAPASTSG